MYIVSKFNMSVLVHHIYKTYAWVKLLKEYYLN